MMRHLVTLAFAIAIVGGGALGGCATDDLDQVEPPSFLRFDPPPDCDGALFARTFAQCPEVSLENSFPNIWEAMAPTLTREGVHALFSEHRSAIDACCGDNPSIIETDIVIGCGGEVLDLRVRAPWLVGGCVEDAVRTWTFARPAPSEQGIHLLVPCGEGA